MGKYRLLLTNFIGAVNSRFSTLKLQRKIAVLVAALTVLIVGVSSLYATMSNRPSSQDKITKVKAINFKNLDFDPTNNKCTQKLPELENIEPEPTDPGAVLLYKSVATCYEVLKQYDKAIIAYENAAERCAVTADSEQCKQSVDISLNIVKNYQANPTAADKKMREREISPKYISADFVEERERETQ